jgi:hypothetical protein
MVVYGGVVYGGCMVVWYGGVCMVVYGGVWWCVYGGDIDNPSGRAVHPQTAAHEMSSGSALIRVFVYGAWCRLYLKVVYEFRVDVFLLRHVLTFFIEYDVVLKGLPDV